jgi:hypothetical protein
MRRLAVVASFVLLLTSVVAASDLSGKWSGSFLQTLPDGSKKDSQAFMDLKQSGTEITGTAGPSESQQMEIRKGKVAGDKITFEIQGDNQPVISFELTLVDGHLKGEARAERDGQKMSALLDLQRTAK